MPRYPEFIGGFYTVQSPITDQEETVNWYMEQSESKGTNSPNSLLPTPGFESFAAFTAVGGRAAFTVNRASGQRVFTVYGASFIEVFNDGTYTVRGSVASDGNPATISDNGDGGEQLFITSGDHGYCYELATDALTEVLTSGATMGGMLYGYFVAFDKTNSQIRISDLFDGQTWDPTQFAQNSLSPDPWTSMLVTPYGQILLLGSQTGQFWFNAGTFPFPFALDPAGLIEEGIAATFAIKQASKSPVWLSTNKNGGYQVMRANGFSPQRISNHAVEYELSQLSRLTNAVAETYEDQGHSFFALTFPSDNLTRVYDFSTGQWHRRGTWISEQDHYTYSRPVFHCFAFGKHLMTDRESNVLYQQDIHFTMDIESRVIRRVRRAPAVMNQDKRLFFTKFEILLESGIGFGTGNTSAPVVMMRKSDDGGRTWSGQRTVTAGSGGQYSQRVIFWQTGAARKRVYEVSVTDAINNWRITDAYLEIEPSDEGQAA